MKLDSRIKRLIAIGASVTANCQPCLKKNISKALEDGANVQEILEAIAVAKMVRRGASAKMDQFASTIFKAAEETAVTSEKGCGCGL